MVTGFGQHGMPPPVCNLTPFDLETGVRVASKVGNLHSEFGHARPLGSRIIRYVCKGWTDRETDGRPKATLIAPFPAVGGMTSATVRGRMGMVADPGIRRLWSYT